MKITTEFKGDDGSAMTVSFDEATNSFSTNQGAKGAYKADAATHTIAISSDQFSGTIRFEGAFVPKVGAVTRYSVSDGRSGLATIVDLE